MMNDDCKALAVLARTLGQDVSIVQGGGGNFSVKDDSDVMYVKSSGVRFDKMSEYEFVAIDLQSFRHAFEQESRVVRPRSAHEAVVNNALIEFCKSVGRPSMETAMHCFLPRVVLHTHAVVANVLLCMDGGELIARDLFADLKNIWIPYVSPGYTLGETVMKQGNPAPEVFFLQNHGIIVCGDKVARVGELLSLVVERCTRYLKERLPPLRIFSRTWLSTHYHPQRADKFLFPDAAVYANKPDSEAARETLGAQAYIEEAIKALSSTPRYLPPEEVEYLRTMEAEKYRQEKV